MATVDHAYQCFEPTRRRRRMIVAGQLTWARQVAARKSTSGQSRPGRSDSSSSHVCGGPKAEVSRALRLLEALDGQHNFEPFRLAEACAWPRPPLPKPAGMATSREGFALG